MELPPLDPIPCGTGACWILATVELAFVDAIPRGTSEILSRAELSLNGPESPRPPGGYLGVIRRLSGLRGPVWAAGTLAGCLAGVWISWISVD